MSSSGEESPAKGRNVRISSTLLYGIFVSKKSYLIGIRRLMTREHADMLASKIIGTVLPQELIDLVIDQLHAQLLDTVHSNWTVGAKSQEKNISKFEQGIYDSPALRSTHSRMVRLNITTTPVQNTRPITGNGVRLSTPSETTYIHLSMRPPRPSLSMSLPSRSIHVPHPLAATNPAVFYYARNALVRIRTRANDDDQGILHEDEATYLPGTDLSESGEENVQVNRLLQCDGVVEAIRSWDQEQVQRFVDLLGLCVVPVEPSDAGPMTPGLHIWQRIEEAHA